MEIGYSSTCRSCLKLSTSLHDFQEFFYINDEIVQLAECIKFLTGIIVIDNDETTLPSGVCDECFLQLYQFLEFRKQFIESDNCLKDQLKELQIVLKSDQQYSNVARENNIVEFQESNPLEYDNGGVILLNSPYNTSKSKIDEVWENFSSTDSDDELTEEIVNYDVTLKFGDRNKTNVKIENDYSRNNRITKKEKLLFRSQKMHPNYNTERLCSICGHKSKSEQSYRIHMRTHDPSALLSCKLCDRKFVVATSLKEHEKIHTGEKPFKCSYCNYRCVSKGSMTIHLRTHTNEKPFKCKLCDYASKISSHLHVHVKRHHSNVEYPCVLCSRIFKVEYILKAHMKKHDPANYVTCKICGTTFNCNGHLKRHMQIHNK